jgi:hypothetical protein
VLHVIEELDEVLASCWEYVAGVQARQTADRTDCQRTYTAGLIIQGYKKCLQPAAHPRSMIT